jgi:histidinol dehydrogenase
MSAPISLRFDGEWRSLDPALRDSLLGRTVALSDEVRATTARVVADVRERGDEALRDLARRFDGVALDALEVPRARLRRALDELDGGVRRALERAAANIATVHRASRPVASCVTPAPGVTVMRRPDPLRRVGVYAPGGRASYPSSVLMAAVPAKVAGVAEVVLCSPPDAADGAPPSAVLAAAAMAGVDRVFAIGGAGAVAAMAFGTRSVPRVDRIVGPGNAYVAAAKLLVVDRVGIDCPAGPSELVVIADGTSDTSTVALEMVAQAEHDPQAVVVALVVGAPDAAALRDELSARCAAAPRGEIVAAALRELGGVITVADVEEAVAVANAIAPEHLLIVAADAPAIANEVRNAGSVFVGASSSVAFGDYITGANHVLPTGGAARSYSGLSTLDFVRWTTIQTVDAGAAARFADDVATLSDAETLPGHAAAALRWRVP